MTVHDEGLGRALRELDVPYHGPDFYSRLAERLDQEPTRRWPGRHRPRWIRPPMLLSLGAVAAAVVAVMAMSTMLGGERPDVLVEVGGGTIPRTTGVPAPTTLAAPAPTTTTIRPGMDSLTAASTLDLGGLGPVRIGMTPAEATAAAGTPFEAGSSSLGSECSYATVTGAPAGVGFMMADGRIVRIEVRQGSAVKTLSGAGIGDTEAGVQTRYANSLEVSPHKYLPAGRYLTLVPADPTDAGSRLIFETDGSKVTNFRVGTLPQVALVEGCG